MPELPCSNVESGGFMNHSVAEEKKLKALRRILAHVAETLDLPFSVRLWDGSQMPLGHSKKSPFFIAIHGPRTISTLLRAPSLENLLRHYAAGKIDIGGGDILEFMELARQHNPKKLVKKLSKSLILSNALRLFFSPVEKLALQQAYAKDEAGVHEAGRNNRDYIQFHYDVGNAFYALFLDEQMQYSCGYFKNRENSIQEAQTDKLEHICRKLRLKPGESLLDIGCGWGGLLCYAAKNHGVRAHGVTLSKEQHAYTLEKARREGLEGKVTVELGDYQNVQGIFDKAVSVGMFEHIGLQNIPAYFSKINSLLRDRGVFLNHAITRRAKGSQKKFDKMRRERRLFQKYFFPGAALDHIGHSVQQMEIQGFEVSDVESLREHYAYTLRHWTRRLESRREEAVRLVGPEKYRLWVGYLAAVSFGFFDGSLNIYQTVAVKRQSKGFSGLPLTREDLYTA